MSEKEAFKTCPSCKKDWQTREEFLADRILVLMKSSLTAVGPVVNMQSETHSLQLAAG